VRGHRVDLTEINTGTLKVFLTHLRWKSLIIFLYIWGSITSVGKCVQRCSSLLQARATRTRDTSFCRVQKKFVFHSEKPFWKTCFLCNAKGIRFSLFHVVVVVAIRFSSFLWLIQTVLANQNVKVVLVEEIPLLVNGKIDRQQMLRDYAKTFKSLYYLLKTKIFLEVIKIMMNFL